MTPKLGIRSVAAGLLAAMFLPGSGAVADTGGQGGAEARWVESGATKSHFNRQAGLQWTNALGDWEDAEGKPQGDTPFAVRQVEDEDRRKVETWDVTNLVRGWLQGDFPNTGILLRAMTGGGATKFISREAQNPAMRPQLLVTLSDGREVSLEATADTFLDSSTVKALGERPYFTVSRLQRGLLQFDLSPLGDVASVQRAELRLHTTEKQYGPTELGVFRVTPGAGNAAAARLDGIASAYPGDRGIEGDSRVVFAADFEQSSWDEEWSELNRKPVTFEITAAAETLRFVPLQGKALKVAIPEGEHRGLNMSYLFKQETGTEPEEIYFRYYLRFGDDWNPTRDGGKLPGIAGTYNKAGWGGRPSDGTNGWSARGSFERIIRSKNNPFYDRTPVGSYVYLPGGGGRYGAIWNWSRNSLGVLARNRWYCIEQHVRLNTPGKKDGVFEVWVDGQKAFEKKDLRFRSVPELKIDRIWMNVYHGGTAVSPHMQHVFIDNVVIAESYIGPLAEVP